MAPAMTDDACCFSRDTAVYLRSHVFCLAAPVSSQHSRIKGDILKEGKGHREDNLASAMVLMTTDCLPLELTQVIFRYFWGLLLVSIVKSIRFHLSKKPALLVTKFKQLGRVSTFHFQASLPRLPLPKLKETCQQYLTAQKGLLSPEEFAVTSRLTQEFSLKGSEGWKLNDRLVKQDQANKHTNFTAGYLKNRYLKGRSSLIYTNPFGIGKKDMRNPSQSVKAAQFLLSGVQYYVMLRDKVLEPQVFCLNGKKKDRLFNLLRFLPEYISSYGAYMMNIIPLDMSIICNAFCCARVPGQEIDKIDKYKESRHVVVASNGHFYSLNVIQPNGQPVELESIHVALEHIMSDSVTPAEFPVGFLTAVGRSDCSKAREELVAIGDNASLLKTIDSSIFVLCIDGKSEANLKLGDIFLHNNGYNRWFDKTLQLIVTRESRFGFNFEHSVLTGGSMLPALDYFYNTCIAIPFPKSLGAAAPLPPGDKPTKLEFSLSDSLKRMIKRGREEAARIAAGFFFHNFHHYNLNKKFVKSKKMSTDGLVQLLFQIAYYRKHKVLPSVSEACSTAAFLHGRTETVRPMSPHSLKCALAMEESSGVSDSEKIALIRTAVSFNSELIKKGATGRGFDRHLFALKSLAESEGLSLPFFEDKGYQRFSTIEIATSAFPTPSADFGGFAPFNYNSIGVTYFIYDDYIGIYIINHPTHDGAKYIENLKKLMDDVYELLQRETSQ